MGEEFPALLGDAVFVLNFGDKQGFLSVVVLSVCF